MVDRTLKDARYTRRHRACRRFTDKVGHIRKRYGSKAANYFLEHQKCERCPENRFPCLDVHHLEGKKRDKFEVLCRNCHAVEHSTSYTFDDVLKEHAIGYRVGRPRKLSS